MNSAKKIHKGGRKGGTQFPRVALKQAVDYAKKLVGKTHVGPQSKTIIWKGVFNNSGTLGGVRASALKQFNLLEGEADSFNATGLAKAINSAPSDELPALLHRACLSSKLFKKLFDTFQNDTVSRAKIRQQALQLDVHPESGDECVQKFIESLQFAGLATPQGEDITIAASPAIQPAKQAEAENGTAIENAGISVDTVGLATDINSIGSAPASSAAEIAHGTTTNVATAAQGMNVTLALDSTMDPEKLERQLKLLRQYGVLK